MHLTLMSSQQADTCLFGWGPNEATILICCQKSVQCVIVVRVRAFVRYTDIDSAGKYAISFSTAIMLYRAATSQLTTEKENSNDSRPFYGSDGRESIKADVVGWLGCDQN